MKTVLTSIITSIITVIVAMLIIHAVSGEGGCMFSDNDGHKTECVDQDKKGCCDKKHEMSGADKHEIMMEKLEPMRLAFEEELSEAEKATISDIRAKFSEGDHENLCPEGMAKFQEQHKDDIAALVAIADNHKAFFDGMYAKMHSEEKCKEADVKKEEACPEAAKCKEATEKCKGEKEVKDAEVKKEIACPEAAKCKEATEKCKGEKANTPEAEAKCKEAEAACKSTCETTFKVHFLLMDTDDNEDDD